MATTYYASFTSDVSTMHDPDHSGTSGTSGDIIELRMGNGTYVPTRFEVLKALELFERWIVQGGLDGAGVNLPPNA